MITMADIIKEGHPTLRQRAAEVTIPPTEEDKATLNKMLEYLKNSQNPEIAAKYGLRAGVGLAAPQINISKRMIAIYGTDEKDKLHSYTLFNPKIVSHSVQKAYLSTGEGCLSVDRPVPGYVPRYHKVKVQAFNMDGEPVTIRLTGMMAIVIQHEIDHLNGVMFYDHINEDQPFPEVTDAVIIER
jgi:peptide deformylase